MLSPATLAATCAALSTDAFAAALARGGVRPTLRPVAALKTGAVFGASEGGMCLAGWLSARAFAELIAAVDHWIALIVLGAIGAKMIHAGLAGDAEGHRDADGDAPRARTTWLGTVLTALGTSVDAAAVGVTFALTAVSAWATLAMGLTSFVVAAFGAFIGPFAGARLGRRAEVAGGAVLIAVGALIFHAHVFG